MSYVTAKQMSDGPDGIKELSELYGVDAPLLVATLSGDDRSAWSEVKILAADEALASIERFIVQAGGEVDARLARRGYQLPQDPQRFPVLSVWARAIARYHIHRQRDRTSEDTGRIERDYRDALRALDAVAAGTLSLGAGDPLATGHGPGDTGGIHVAGSPRIFSRGSLGAL